MQPIVQLVQAHQYSFIIINVLVHAQRDFIIKEALVFHVNYLALRAQQKVHILALNVLQQELTYYYKDIVALAPVILDTMLQLHKDNAFNVKVLAILALHRLHAKVVSAHHLSLITIIHSVFQLALTQPNLVDSHV
jgi:hypothetical protein